MRPWLAFDCDFGQGSITAAKTMDVQVQKDKFMCIFPHDDSERFPT